MSKAPLASKWVKRVVRDRDGNRCRICGRKESKKEKFQVHHIKPRCTHPELVDDPDNCLLVCPRDHRMLHNE